MKKSIIIFGKQIPFYHILFYGIFLILFSIYSFLEKPFIKGNYLDNEIDYFKDNYSWKIYLLLMFIFVAFVLYRVEKTKEKVAESIMFLLFSLLIQYLWLNSFITINALYINQIKSVEKENFVYKVYNYEKEYSLSGIKPNNEHISGEEFLDKIDNIRKRNRLKPLNQVKDSDTVNVVFDKGLFGFKYLK